MMEKSREELLSSIKTLEERLWEAEQTIRAIRDGEVDALVVHEPVGTKLYTLKGADHGYRILVESISEGALILSPDGAIYYCNQRFGEMLQVPIRKITGKTFDSFIDPESCPEVMGLIEESRIRGKAEGEFSITRADGTLLPVKLSLNSVDLDYFNGICAVMTDLTFQKRTEQELRNSAETLRRSNVELQDFAFIASHDLQEPLRKIQAFGNRLERTCVEKLDETERDSLTRLQNSANRMQQLIRDLLSYSRLGTRQEPPGEVELSKAAKEAASNLEVRIERTEARVEIADLPTIHAERSQIEQLFQNLILNALKFRSEETPRIRIYSNENNEGCRIFIEDNGIGFEEVYLDRIFAPFQRLHGRSAYEGTGMGLTICRKIVERHGGSITAKSKPGKGSTFIITFPLDRVVAHR